MPIIVLRHGERADYVDASWVAQSLRPWDPPLTGVGGRDACSPALTAASGRCAASISGMTAACVARVLPECAALRLGDSKPFRRAPAGHRRPGR
jgi:hypothetical protein